ncbi:MAG: S8 family peptidase [Culicoidibacterales bacterium]
MKKFSFKVVSLIAMVGLVLQGVSVGELAQLLANKEVRTMSKEESTMNNEESTVNSEESTVNSEESTVNNEEGTVNNEESTVNNEESTSEVQADRSLAVSTVITAEENQLLGQYKNRSLAVGRGSGESLNFLNPAESEEAFIVLLENDSNNYETAKEIFAQSEGKKVGVALGTAVVVKQESGQTDEAFMQNLQAIDGVKLVEKNIKLDFKTSFVPNDPYYSEQFELKQMGMERVWDITRGKGVKIGILDVGFEGVYLDRDSSEFDLNRILPVKITAPDNSCYPVEAGGGHGASVLSIAGGTKTNNRNGMASVANESTFQPYISGDSCDADGSFRNSLVAFTSAFDHAIETGVNVMNMSFGGAYRNAIIEATIARANQSGMILVAARGNAGGTRYDTSAIYPGCYDDVVLVGSINKENQKSGFSSFTDCGSETYLTAYGDAVKTAKANRSGGVDISRSYGTSFSSPVTAGVIAMMKSVKPSASSEEIRRVLRETATDIGWSGYDQETGHGAINPLAAVEKMEPYVIRDGNVIYFLNQDFTVKYSSEWQSGLLLGYKEYYAGAKHGNNLTGFVKNIIKTDRNGDVFNSTEIQKNSIRVISIKEYPKGIKYGAHAEKEQVTYYINQFNEIGHMEKKAAGKPDYTATYHKGAQYPRDNQTYIKYVIYFNLDGTVKYSREQEKITKMVKKYVEYEPNTKYGEHIKKEVARYYISSNNNISTSEVVKNNTVVAILTYYPNSIYGVANSVKKRYVFNVTPNKTLINAEEYSSVTGKLLKIFYFEEGTKYGENHNKKVIRIVNK